MFAAPQGPGWVPCDSLAINIACFRDLGDNYDIIGTVHHLWQVWVETDT